MNIYISSFYKSNISPYFVFYQKQVCKMLGIKLHQVCNDAYSHGDYLNAVLNNAKADYYIFFDIDCIPLSNKAIDRVLKVIKNNATISGCAQTANQFNNGKNRYVGPCFFGISKAVYQKLGNPDLNRNDQDEVDIAGILSKLAPSHNILLDYLEPSEIELPKWYLHPDSHFGIGTTYENLVYHLYESRYSSNTVKFIRKSKQTINKFWYLNPLKYFIIILNIQLFKIKMLTKTKNIPQQYILTKGDNY